MSWDLHTKSVLKALQPRREPWWGPPLAKGRHIGFRKIGAANTYVGTWIARMWDEEKGDYVYKSLGQFNDKLDYTRAKKDAETWFKERDAGISDKPPTVTDVCKEYVKDLEAEGRTKTAYDAKVRFKRAVYDHKLGTMLVSKARTQHYKDWRNGVAGEKAAQDRSFRSLKAALNLAVRNRRVSPELAIEWKSVPPHKNAEKRREIYLDLTQRRALIEAAKGGARDLIEAAAHTGARPGELVALKVKDFDARTKTISFGGKTGGRSVPVSDAAVTLFKRLAKDKLPAAYLLTMDDGEPWKHSAWWAEAVRDAATEAKLQKGVSLYVLRHSWITEALRGGMSTLDVARLTGTSLQMIQSHYGHLVADSARERLALVTML
jgi:integrase